eukprot:TRINITY_DN65798_c6_g2_i1.p1 TRINITY_DN65798_c6_g2~~TRINITY_DN65798_c6_g2_i1.p1  ORF type:complete len:136 (+),score=9.71 TRINITY_DN65798_c6_g2_i1:345-752(+)
MLTIIMVLLWVPVIVRHHAKFCLQFLPLAMLICLLCLVLIMNHVENVLPWISRSVQIAVTNNTDREIFPLSSALKLAHLTDSTFSTRFLVPVLQPVQIHTFSDTIRLMLSATIYSYFVFVGGLLTALWPDYWLQW